MRVTLLSAIPILIVFVAIFVFLFKKSEVTSSEKTLKVLTYSAFLNTWGPGPEIAQKFLSATGVHVEFINGGEAGLLLKKLSLFDADVVLGLDQFAIAHRDSNIEFKTAFVPIDWSPMTFIYRKSEVSPPKNLDDLLDSRFEKKIAISDPRTSTPGLQFLLWVLKVKGREQGFAFLKKLKKNIVFVGSNWSASYGHFKKHQSQLVFSYVTSPVYHWTEEKNLDYQAAILKESLVSQIEYAVVPKGSKNFVQSEKFIQFLRTDEIQKLIMQKNFMLPIRSEVTKDTPFERLQVSYISEEQMKPESSFSEAELQSILTEWQAIGF